MALNSGLPVATPNIPPLPNGATYATGPDGKTYVKYATQNQNGQWVQTVSTVVNGVLIPLINSLFPNGVVPNNNGATILPNGTTIGGFQNVNPYQDQSGNNNTNTLVLAGVGIAGILLLTNSKSN